MAPGPGGYRSLLLKQPVNILCDGPGLSSCFLLSRVIYIFFPSLFPVNGQSSH